MTGGAGQSRGLQKTIESLRGTFRDLGDGVHAVAAACTELNVLSNQIAGSTASTSQRTSTVAAAAEEMSGTAQVKTAAGELSQRAERLDGQPRRFKV